jgi:hypothetical protein
MCSGGSVKPPAKGAVEATGGSIWELNSASDAQVLGDVVENTYDSQSALQGCPRLESPHDKTDPLEALIRAWDLVWSPED